MLFHFGKLLHRVHMLQIENTSNTDIILTMIAFIMLFKQAGGLISSDIIIITLDTRYHNHTNGINIWH